MTDLTSATDVDLLAAIKARSDAKIAEALPHVDALIAILNPEGNILQHSAAEGGARAVFQSCTTFRRIADQLAALNDPNAAPDPAAAPKPAQSTQA